MRILVTIAFAAVTATAAGQPPGGDDGARLLAQWEQRRTIPATRYALRWELFPTEVRPGAPKPGEDGAYTGSGAAVVDVPNGRVRVDQDELMHFRNRPERLSRVRQTFRFDGRDQFAYLAIDLDAAKAPAEPKVEPVYVGDWGRAMRWPGGFDPLLWAHGLTAPVIGWHAGPFPQAWQPGPGRFQPSGREDVAGRACVVFRDAAATSKTTLWVDAEHGGVVRMRAVYESGGARETTVAYRDTPRGRLPAGWEEGTAKANGSAVVERRVTVESVAFEPPAADAEFRVAFTPGMIVENRGASSRVTADGSLELLNPPVGALPQLGAKVERVLDVLGWVGTAGLAVALALTGGLVWTRGRRSRPASAA